MWAIWFMSFALRAKRALRVFFVRGERSAGSVKNGGPIRWLRSFTVAYLLPLRRRGSALVATSTCIRSSQRQLRGTTGSCCRQQQIGFLGEFLENSPSFLGEFSENSPRILRAFSECCLSFVREFSENSPRILRGFSENSPRILREFSVSTLTPCGCLSDACF